MGKVLVISDDRALVAQMREIREYSFYSIQDMPQLQEFLPKLEYFRLVLFDLTTALPDSAAVFKALVASQTPVVLIARKDEDAFPYIENGALDYIVKPAMDAVLRLRLKSALRPHQDKFFDFVRFAVHELKNPLMPVKGYSSAMLSGMGGTLTGEQAEFTEIIFSNSVRIDKLLNDLRDMAMIDSGTMKLSLTETSLSDVLKPVMLHFEKAAAKKSITMTLEMGDDLPFLMTHGAYLARILHILVDNALNYSDMGKAICVGAAVKPGLHACPENSLEIVVQDSGYGIPEDEQHKILTSRHFRSADKRARDLPGNGISLYIARHLTDALGGRLWFESTPEIGTAFYLSLPVPQ